ncbi:MAG: hypothetical protein JWO30_398 [Fibrobacteres bacterium]|nr:hypothetical protein [Fibrobacterota bacterium]
MKLVTTPEGPFLEHQGRSIRLDERDLLHLTRMTPLGRKVYFARKGKVILAVRTQDAEAELLLAWSRMPAREWSFPASI